MDFWKKRVQELEVLKATAQHREWEVILLGDCNAHIARLAASFEGWRERGIAAMIEGSSGMGLSVRNPEWEPNHKSDTVIDLVAASMGLAIGIEVVRKGHPRAASDHNSVDVKMGGRGLQCQRTAQLCRSRWDADADWGQEFAMFPRR